MEKIYKCHRRNNDKTIIKFSETDKKWGESLADLRDVLQAVEQQVNDTISQIESTLNERTASINSSLEELETTGNRCKINLDNSLSTIQEKLDILDSKVSDVVKEQDIHIELLRELPRLRRRRENCSNTKRFIIIINDA